MITKTERKSLRARDFSDSNIEILKKYLQSNVYNIFLKGMIFIISHCI